MKKAIKKTVVLVLAVAMNLTSASVALADSFISYTPPACTVQATSTPPPQPPGGSGPLPHNVRR
jgi:hypothetical protein